MTKLMLTDRPLHPEAQPIADSFRGGRMNRREFLATMAAAQDLSLTCRPAQSAGLPDNNTTNKSKTMMPPT